MKNGMSLEKDKKNEIKARQGVRYPNTEGAVTVMDPETMKACAARMEKLWVKL